MKNEPNELVAVVMKQLQTFTVQYIAKAGHVRL